VPTPFGCCFAGGRGLLADIRSPTRRKERKTWLSFYTVFPPPFSMRSFRQHLVLSYLYDMYGFPSQVLPGRLHLSSPPPGGVAAMSAPLRASIDGGGVLFEGPMNKWPKNGVYGRRKER
jgi:hypothetical protein